MVGGRLIAASDPPTNSQVHDQADAGVAPEGYSRGTICRHFIREFFAHSRRTEIIRTSSTGTFDWPFRLAVLTALILSTTSIPPTTRPNTQ